VTIISKRQAQTPVSKRQAQAPVSKRQATHQEVMELAEKKKKKTKGFENNAKKISSKQGISMERARAILAAGARKASPAAKRRNPALKKVKGKAKRSY
jgi:hypothetical protein